jgi:hypothetical protein
VLYAASAASATFSYQTGWPQALARDPRFDCRLVNLAGKSPLSRLMTAWQLRTERFDVVLLLHSVFSNGCMLGGRLFDAVQKIRAPKVYFIGNEYKLMPEKMAFCSALGISLLVSQSSSARVHALYRSRLGCDVVGIPNTGIDLQLFAPAANGGDRPIDLGYRADDAPLYLGHNERRAMATFFQEHAAAYGLRLDLSLRPENRLAGPDWVSFLSRCRGQLGTEAGGDYFSLDDEYRLAVNAFVTTHPDATLDEIRRRFFDRVTNAVPMRIISGRNVEAAAARSVQLLFDGEYDGYLRPDEHYIAVRKDFSNIGEVLERFQDRAFCRRLTDNAYDLAATEFTYAALVGRVRDAIAPFV